MPIRIPVVNGIFNSPASRSIFTRTWGRLSGALWCGMPFSQRRSLMFSSIKPRLTFTGRRRCMSCRDRMPALVCGNRPCCSARSAAQYRYSTVLW